MDAHEPLLYEDLIFLNYKAKDREELLQNLSEILKEKGFVKESYMEGILTREKNYPTGLNTNGVKVAMPHADASHVVKPAILVAKLESPIIFKEMGNGIHDVEARLIFMLAIKNPDLHVTTLSKLMSIFSDKDKLISIFASTTKKEVMSQIKQVLV
jgi:PTS system galactitol-specific IIA component